MPFGLVVGVLPDGRNVNTEWDPAEGTPVEAMMEFLECFPEAIFYSITETQCDGTIRPIEAGTCANIRIRILEEASG